MDAVQIAFALLDVWEKLSRNLPDLDLKTKTLTLGHSEAARALAKMLDERVGAREQLAAACIADPSLAARLEAVAEAMPFAESLLNSNFLHLEDCARLLQANLTWSRFPGGAPL